ncbi:unnamed protein product [Ceratitis capitata]|uniref:(Mediterranean fruit fly) hypothetical protein n=1 Tax=Ceratitis capitata TaxID=7213 RepID=A0A811V953_CERCA|nr:unnamed protein product [Ceratitis capitata]
MKLVTHEVKLRFFDSSLGESVGRLKKFFFSLWRVVVKLIKYEQLSWLSWKKGKVTLMRDSKANGGSFPAAKLWQ